MDCKNVQHKAFDFALGNLPAEEMAGVQEHLNACSECRLIVQAWNSLHTAMNRERGLEPGPFFYTRLEQRMKNREGIAVSSLKPVFSWALTVVMVFFLLASLSGGFLAGRWADQQGLSFSSQSQESYKLGSDYFLNDSTNYELEKILLSDNR